MHDASGYLTHVPQPALHLLRSEGWREPRRGHEPLAPFRRHPRERRDQGALTSGTSSACPRPMLLAACDGGGPWSRGWEGRRGSRLGEPLSPLHAWSQLAFEAGAGLCATRQQSTVSGNTPVTRGG